MKKKPGKKSLPLGSFSMETKEAIKRGQRGYCQLCEKKIDDIHHRVHNTETNRQLFPAFISSVFNGVGLCRKCHQDRSHECEITLSMAVEYEQELRVADENVSFTETG